MALDVITIEEERAPQFFQQLVHGTYAKKNQLPAADYVFTKIFALLAETHAAFVPRTDLDPIDVLSMAGRALFWRFLIDRGIVLETERSEIVFSATDLKDCFSSAENAAQTSAWLDETFNGDFLPLIDESIPSDDRPAREAAYRRYYRHAGKSPRIFFGISTPSSAVGEPSAADTRWNSIGAISISRTFRSECSVRFTKTSATASTPPARRRKASITPPGLSPS